MHAIALAACCLLSGNVHAVAGAPLAGVAISVHGPVSARSTTDAQGNFSLKVEPGAYRLDALERGFAPVSIAVSLRHDVTVRIALEALDAPSMRVIGHASVDGRLTPIQGAIPSIQVTRAQMQQSGQDRIVDALQSLPGATFAHPDGGAASAVSVVALRGPDPSESLVALDGQLLNDGNTGDLDLSRLPVAAFSAVDVTEGLGPQDTNGSNTFGGSIDLISLRPTLAPHDAASISIGSFGSNEAWFNATNTQGKLGYAFAIDDQNQAGYVNQTVPLSTITPAGAPAPPAPTPTHLGSSIAAHTGLGALTWTFSQNADLTARVFLLGDIRDQSSAINGIDGNPGDQTYGAFVGPGNQTFAQTLRAYQLRGRSPLGAGELTAEISRSDNGVDLTGGVSSAAYDVTHVDRRDNLALTWQRTFARAQYAIGGYTRYESLAFLDPTGAEPHLGQSINVYFARGGFHPTPKLRLDAGLFESHYSTFGSNLDGRFDAIYAAAPSTSMRFSIGTGFRAPLLIERYQFPLAQLQQDAYGVFLGQGNPNEHPEHATEFELGLSHEFSHNATLDASLYRTNLRNPIEIYYPQAAINQLACAGNSVANPIPGCVSFNSNDGNAVYEGAEVRFAQHLPRLHLFLTAMYGLNVAYPTNLDASFSNPTSGGNLVNNAQFLGIPQQQGSLQADWSRSAWHASIAANFRGKNNELYQAPFTIVNATVGRQLTSHVDLAVAATNLFNDAAGRFTVFGGGVPYRGVVGVDPISGTAQFGAIPTNGFYVEPLGLRVILTIQH